MPDEIKRVKGKLLSFQDGIVVGTTDALVEDEDGSVWLYHDVVPLRVHVEQTEGVTTEEVVVRDLELELVVED